MNTLGLVLHQVRYEWRSFWRNPAAAFFGAIFPLIFLLIFNLVFGNNEITVPGGTTHASTFYVPAIAAMAVIITERRPQYMVERYIFCHRRSVSSGFSPISSCRSPHAMLWLNGASIARSGTRSDGSAARTVASRCSLVRGRTIACTFSMPRSRGPARIFHRLTWFRARYTPTPMSAP